MSSESVVLKILLEAKGAEVSLELSNGEVYTGTMVDVQDNMNIILSNATKTSKSGTETVMASVLIRGSNVVFFQLPEELQMSPAVQAAGKLPKKSHDTRGDGKGFGAGRRTRHE